ncbi:hypothetical protein GCM10029964_017890 [Kibdelosporangium lantanae]
MELTPVEQRLVESVEAGEPLDLAGDGPVDVVDMLDWGPDRTISARVIREIVRGRLAADPDPQGIRLRGAKVDGRLDLEYVTSKVPVDLRDCLLQDGLNATDANLTTLLLTRCRLSHPTDPPLQAVRLTATVLALARTSVVADNAVGGVVVRGARLGVLSCFHADFRNNSGPAIEAGGLRVEQDVSLDDVKAAGAGLFGAVRLGGARLGARLICAGAQFTNGSGPALVGDRMRVEQDVTLDMLTAAGAGADGVVRLLGARIGGRLDCTGARLSNDDGPALVLDGVRVEENVFLGSLVATGSGAGGTVSLGNATFGSLDCVGARMYNGSGPALNAADLTVAGNVFLDRLDAVSDGENVTLNFAGTVVKGQFEFSPARVEHRAHRSQRLWLDGLTYNGLPVGSPLRLGAADQRGDTHIHTSRTSNWPPLTAPWATTGKPGTSSSANAVTRSDAKPSRDARNAPGRGSPAGCSALATNPGAPSPVSVLSSRSPPSSPWSSVPTAGSCSRRRPSSAQSSTGSVLVWTWAHH